MEAGGSMERRVDIVAVVAVVLCVMVLVGGLSTYLQGVHSYDAEIGWNDGSVDIRTKSSGSDVYDVVLIDNGKRTAVSDVAVYVDGTYSKYYDKACRSSDPPYLSQKYYAEQVSTFLKVRSFGSVSTCDTEALLEYLERTVSDPSGHSVLVSSYALPSSVYDGTADCILLKWIGAGGTLYWVGSEIGRFYTDSGGLHKVDGNQALFLGNGRVNTAGSTIATERIENGFAEALCLKNSNVQNGVDVSGVEGALAIGYSENGYSSIAFVPLGAGTVCVFAGPFDINQLDDIGQVVASGLSCDSSIVSHVRGTVSRGWVSERIDFEGSPTSAYVFIGGAYVKYAEASHV